MRIYTGSLDLILSMVYLQHLCHVGNTMKNDKPYSIFHTPRGEYIPHIATITNDNQNMSGVLMRQLR